MQVHIICQPIHAIMAYCIASTQASPRCLVHPGTHRGLYGVRIRAGALPERRKCRRTLGRENNLLISSQTVRCYARDRVAVVEGQPRVKLRESKKRNSDKGEQTPTNLLSLQRQKPPSKLASYTVKSLSG